MEQPSNNVTKKLRVNLFVPPPFTPNIKGLGELQKNFCNECHYASSGRWALIHILEAKQLRGKILIPAFICDSVNEVLIREGFTPCFYDIDEKDLNPSVDSLKKGLEREKPVAVVVPSLYGNPADLIDIERVCRDRQVFMIDDAAQSFGAKLGGKNVGQYGDAGFFSFSPGKNLAGAMGAYWRIAGDKFIPPKLTKGISLQKRIIWLYWKVFRYRANRVDLRRTSILRKLTALAYRVFDLKYQNVCRFELPLLGGLLAALFGTEFSFRFRQWDELSKCVDFAGGWRVVKAIRGMAYPNKFVLVAPSIESANKLERFLSEFQITFGKGYLPLFKDPAIVPITLDVFNRVVELPLENDKIRHKKILETLILYFEKKNEIL